MKKNQVIWIIVFLACVTGFSVYKYAQSLREKVVLKGALADAKVEVNVLSSDKQALEAELAKEKAFAQEVLRKKELFSKMVRAGSRHISKLATESASAKERFADLSATLSLLKEETQRLKEDGQKLQERLASTMQENEMMKAKLSSVPELKKAIRDLKIESHKLYWELRKKRFEATRLIKGNGGFLMKNGKPTITSKVNIEVMPAGL